MRLSFEDMKKPGFAGQKRSARSTRMGPTVTILEYAKLEGTLRSTQNDLRVAAEERAAFKILAAQNHEVADRLRLENENLKVGHANATRALSEMSQRVADRERAIVQLVLAAMKG